MGTYIAILLLIVPGFIARKVYERLNCESKPNGDFENTIISLIYSVFIIICSYFLLCLLPFNVTCWEDIRLALNNPNYAIAYAIISIFLSIGVALIHNEYRNDAIRWVNNIRKRDAKSELVANETVWNALFNDGDKHTVLIEINGKEYEKGIIQRFSSNEDGPNELWLVSGNNLEIVLNSEEHKPHIKRTIKGVYLNLDKNLKVTEFDTQKLADLFQD